MIEQTQNQFKLLTIKSISLSDNPISLVLIVKKKTKKAKTTTTKQLFSLNRILWMLEDKFR